MFPKLFELGPLTIHTYGLLLATAFLLGTAVASRLAPRDGIPPSRVWDLAFVIIISALLGAKLLMVLSDAGYYLTNPSRLFTLDFWRAGGVFYGGLIGAVFGSFLYLRRDKKTPFWSMGDAIAPSIALGQGIGRLGCFSAGCDYGIPSDLPWAVTFASQYAQDKVGVPLGIPLHPVQLYESSGAFLIFGFLFWLHSRRRFQGQVFCLYFLLYGVLRFAVEFFRGDLDRGFVAGGEVSVSQAISVVLVLTAVTVYEVLRSRSKEKP